MILVLNCGSQSIKWKIFDGLKPIKEGNKFVFEKEKFAEILEKELKSITDAQIEVVGHRVVHGKDVFTGPTEITPENIGKLETLNSLAPLHNPFNVLGIKICQKVFPNAKQIAVFDTEFFKDLPEIASTYALPEEIRGNGFRKYGFHGISHEYVAKIASERIKKPFNKLKIITCHLGGGASITAINSGKAVETSMGFTPMQGLVMMTRAGDIDSGIVLNLVKEFGAEKVEEILNKESGVKGICGIDNMLEVISEIEKGNLKAKLAFDVFVYSIKKYIGAYFSILGGCDVLVFTGSIGAGLEITRNTVCKDLNILKKTKILAMETDEELAIAQKIINHKK